MNTRTSIAALLLTILLLVQLTPISSFAQERGQVVILNKKCVAGPYQQPNGPFAVLVFCEDALGNYIVLYYKDIMENPLSAQYPKWLLGKRVWEDSQWGSDVTSFAWGVNGNHLYVATSSVYGDGGLFDVDLVQRTSKRILPTGKFESGVTYVSEVLGTDNGKPLLKVLITRYYLKKTTEERVELPIE